MTQRMNTIKGPDVLPFQECSKQPYLGCCSAPGGGGERMAVRQAERSTTRTSVYWGDRGCGSIKGHQVHLKAPHTAQPRSHASISTSDLFVKLTQNPSSTLLTHFWMLCKLYKSLIDIVYIYWMLNLVSLIVFVCLFVTVVLCVQAACN